MSGADTPGGQRRRALWNRLSFRLGLGLLLGGAAIFVIVGQLNLSLQSEHMLDLLGETASQYVETVRRATRDAMLRNEPEEVRTILGEIGSQESIQRIRIFDKGGTIRVSTHPVEEGEEVDKRAEQCYACHREDEPLESLSRPDRVRIFEGPGGGRTLAVIDPIRNEPDCVTACHGHSAAEKLLGVLDVQVSLDEVDRHLLASEKQMGVMLLLAVLGVVVLVIFLMWRMVLHPVGELTRATTRVARGDLEAARMRIKSSDEIGTMARHWNTMVEELERARRELQEWNRTLEQRVEEKTQELEAAHQQMLMVEKMASLGKLSAVVAHEINNPLAGIGTYAKLLRKKLRRKAERTASAEGEADDGEAVRILAMVEEEANRCGRIVQNLLLFSRTPGARFQETDLAALLDRCIMLVQHQADLQEIAIHKEIDPALPPVVCDASQIQQVVLVLSLNAIEAMPDGGSLTLRAQPHWDDRVQLVVEDTGCGIPPENLPHIFEPFFSTKEQVSGCGLGLAVAYGIVQRHKGRIDVDSAPGTGTSFTVTLPRIQAQQNEEATDAT